MLDGFGNLGINTTTPAERLYVAGNMAATGNITAYASDRRLKRRIEALQDVLGVIQRLGGYRFVWRDDVEGLLMRGSDVGLLAQELEEAGLREFVALAPFDNEGGVSKSGKNYKTIHYAKLHALWLVGIKEQQKIIDHLKKEVKDLRQQMGLQQRTTEELLVRVAALETK